MRTEDGAQALIQGRPVSLAVAEASVLVGLEPHAIRVEVCCTRGPAFFQMVGLAEAAVREARVRVSSALARIGVLLDEHAITVNLAPADLRKSAAGLDVAIALAVLAAIGRLPSSALDGWLVLGELSLDGTLRPVRGVLPLLEGARERGVTHALVPTGNTREAGLVRGLDTRVAGSLAEIVAAFTHQGALAQAGATRFEPAPAASGELDLSQVRGQGAARRALEIAAAGAHNLLLVGPPGSGKTLLARLLATVLPPLAFHEAVATTAVHSVAGLVDPARGVVTARPFRAPHHSVSEAGLVGGGDVPRPGEVSLAHHGVLFLDELAEFRRGALEALRQPLEDGHVHIARARARVSFPARPLLVAATNPCPCGWYGHATRRCRCSDRAREQYLARLSGPLLDRIDLHVAVPAVETAALLSAAQGEPTHAVRSRVCAAREAMHARHARAEQSASVNAALGPRDLESVAALDAEGRLLLERASVALGLSARAFAKVLRVARTIADLDGAPRVGVSHLAEAVQYRFLDAAPR